MKTQGAKKKIVSLSRLEQFDCNPYLNSKDSPLVKAMKKAVRTKSIAPNQPLSENVDAYEMVGGKPVRRPKRQLVPATMNNIMFFLKQLEDVDSVADGKLRERPFTMKRLLFIWDFIRQGGARPIDISLVDFTDSVTRKVTVVGTDGKTSLGLLYTALKHGIKLPKNTMLAVEHRKVTGYINLAQLYNSYNSPISARSDNQQLDNYIAACNVTKGMELGTDSVQLVMSALKAVRYCLFTQTETSKLTSDEMLMHLSCASVRRFINDLVAVLKMGKGKLNKLRLRRGNLSAAYEKWLSGFSNRGKWTSFFSQMFRDADDPQIKALQVRQKLPSGGRTGKGGQTSSPDDHFNWTKYTFDKWCVGKPVKVEDLHFCAEVTLLRKVVFASSNVPPSISMRVDVR